MQRAHRPLIRIGLLLLMTYASSPAQACSCLAPGDVLESVNETDAVFVGTVIDRDTERRGDSALIARIKSFFGMEVDHRPDEYRMSLRVDEPFKGVGSSTIEVRTATDSAACGYAFETGRQYVVFAQREEGRLWVSLCSSTARLQDFPAPDLARLRAMGR